MAGDASLWPVVVGGLLSGAFALGGTVGLMGAARRDAAQDRREAGKRRADKFEELVAAIPAHCKPTLVTTTFSTL